MNTKKELLKAVGHQRDGDVGMWEVGDVVEAGYGIRIKAVRGEERTTTATETIQDKGGELPYLCKRRRKQFYNLCRVCLGESLKRNKTTFGRRKDEDEADDVDNRGK